MFAKFKLNLKRKTLEGRNFFAVNRIGGRDQWEAVKCQLKGTSNGACLPEFENPYSLSFKDGTEGWHLDNNTTVEARKIFLTSEAVLKQAASLNAEHGH